LSLKVQLKKETEHQEQLKPVSIESESSGSCSDSDDVNFSPKKRQKSSQQNRLDLEPVAGVLAQHRGQEFTSSIAAKVVNSTLKSIAKISSSDKQFITDRSKLRRES